MNVNNNRVDVGPKIEIKQQMKAPISGDCNAAPDIKSAEKPPRGSKEWYDWILENDKAFIKKQDEVLKDNKVRIKNQDKTLRELEQMNADSKEWMRKYCPEVLEDSSDSPDNSRD